MIPGINPRDMAKAMKKMGIKQEEIDASEVRIFCQDKVIVVSNPHVAKVNMMGEESFQISGEVSEEEVHAEVSEEDISTVMSQAGVERAKAVEALNSSNGDLAAAILSLQDK